MALRGAGWLLAYVVALGQLHKVFINNSLLLSLMPSSWWERAQGWDALHTCMGASILVLVGVFGFCAVRGGVGLAMERAGLAGLLCVLALPLGHVTSEYYFFTSPAARIVECMLRLFVLVAFASGSYWALQRVVCHETQKSLLPLREMRMLVRVLCRFSLARCSLACGIVLFTVSNLLSMWWFSHTPFVNDSIVQYIQAKLWTQGELAWAVNEKDAPEGWGIYRDGKWFSQFLPGHVFFLAIGWLVGMPWVVNPLMALLTAVAIARLALVMYGVAAARIAPLLLACSPMVVILSSEYMNHAPALLGSTLCLLGGYRLLESRSAKDGAISAVGMALVACTRPLSAIALAVALLGWSFSTIAVRPWAYRHSLMAILMVMLPVLGLILAYNQATMGSAFDFAYTHTQASKLDFEADLWRLDPLQATIYLLGRFQDYSMRLFDWPVSSFVFAAFALLMQPRHKAGRLLLLSFICLGVSHFSWEDRIFGPRYIYEASAAMIVLSAKGMTELARVLSATSAQKAFRPWAGVFVVWIVSALFAFSWHTQLASRMKEYAFHYWEGYPAAHQALLYKLRTPALVFIPNKHYSIWVQWTVPSQADDAIIYQRVRGDQSLMIMDDYPDRHVYYTDFWSTKLLRPAENIHE